MCQDIWGNVYHINSRVVIQIMHGMDLKINIQSEKRLTSSLWYIKYGFVFNASELFNYYSKCNQWRMRHSFIWNENCGNDLEQLWIWFLESLERSTTPIIWISFIFKKRLYSPTTRTRCPSNCSGVRYSLGTALHLVISVDVYKHDVQNTQELHRNCQQHGCCDHNDCHWIACIQLSTVLTHHSQQKVSQI